MLAKDDPDLSPEAVARTLEMADFEQMGEIRARVDAVVSDPATPEAGVVVAGHEVELDCLIYATGFEVGTDYLRRSGYDIIGSEGLTLSKKWADGIRTLHGIHIHGFPNCFMMTIAQSGFTVNFPYMINEQAKQIAYVIAERLERGLTRLEVTAEAEAAWVDAVLQSSQSTLEFSQGCTPGYYNNEGQPTAESQQNGFFMGGPKEFVEILEAWRADGGLKGLDEGRQDVVNT